jgi:enoyl-[acyl-carrier protein] reductase III|tara:strand:+ start:17814 stop:18617 length:804 start_codon:yes stop_codon:yes gene_type:complete
MKIDNWLEGHWALILGASSGFGAEVSKKLSEYGVNIIGVHLDRKGTMGNVEEIVSYIQSNGSEAKFFNINAADEEKRNHVLNEASTFIGDNNKKIKILLHSLAFGSLKPYLTEESGSNVTQKQMEMTIDVMANSIVYWTQGIVQRSLFSPNGRIYAMTSAGSRKIWPTYGPVSAAKSALESHIRQISVELAPQRITANSLCAGVTLTPALDKIPGNNDIIDEATRNNPSNRLTLTSDISGSIVALSHPGADWITGNVIMVDGGEELT